MKILAVRSIPMSPSTNTAWKAAGVTFVKRSRSEEWIMDLPYDLVINLGDSNFNPDNTERVVNLGVTIQDLITPGGTRRQFGDLIPPQPIDYPCDVWIKGPGRGGHNKTRMELTHAGLTRRRRSWDTQLHIEGQEYRLITVGQRIVQQHRRDTGPRSVDSVLRGEQSNPRRPTRTYRWEPKQDTPRSVRKLVRKAAARLDTSTVIGWDVILPEEGRSPFLLEGNSCPGVNDATARRIVTELERGYNAES